MENQKLRNTSIALLFSFEDYELVEKNVRNLFIQKYQMRIKIVLRKRKKA